MIGPLRRWQQRRTVRRVMRETEPLVDRDSSGPWPFATAAQHLVPPETVLEEAVRITQGARAETYGSVVDNAESWAEIVRASTGLEVEPHHFPIMMIAVKLSRLAATPELYERDSVVDIAGYSRVAEMIARDQ